MVVNLSHKMTPVKIIAFGYLIVIILGTICLLLPAATKSGESTDFITALFTATSSASLTGLVVVDTYTHWTTFGQIIILIMIQTSGLGFMTIGVLFAMLGHKRISLKARSSLQESLNSNREGGIVKLVKRTIKGTILAEFIGAILLTIRFVSQFGLMKGWYYGIFHAISAFCNAGFDLMGGFTGKHTSLTFYKGDILVNVVIMSLIIVGGIGFVVWDDCRKNRLHIRKYRLHTKMVLSFTVILLVGGSLLFFLFEKDHLMADMNTKEMFLTSGFISVSARTAGFNTMEIASLTSASKLLKMLLMFIGGSPGSTAGGVKTVTVMVLFVYVWSNLRSSRSCNIFGRRLEQEDIKKAVNVVTISVVMTVIATMAICYIQPLPLEDVLFEVVSAITTGGITTGITRDLETASRAIIILLMYCGRVGSMSFALSFIERRKVAPIQLPAEQVMIG